MTGRLIVLSVSEERKPVKKKKKKSFNTDIMMLYRLIRCSVIDQVYVRVQIPLFVLFEM